MGTRSTCALGHQWETGPDQTMACPQCGAAPEPAVSSEEMQDTFRPVDDLPPLPKPVPAAAAPSWSTQMPTSIRPTMIIDTAAPLAYWVSPGAAVR